MAHRTPALLRKESSQRPQSIVAAGARVRGAVAVAEAMLWRVAANRAAAATMIMILFTSGLPSV
jgi:hypothetical protein